jgi:hypothetical protein
MLPGGIINKFSNNSKKKFSNITNNMIKRTPVKVRIKAPEIMI